MSWLVQAWRRRPLLSVLFSLVSLLAAYFAVRVVAVMIYWSDPAHRDQVIEGWMTPRYVARSWDLPPEVMAEALGVGPMPKRRQTIEDIAADRGTTVEELDARIRAAAQVWRDARP